MSISGEDGAGVSGPPSDTVRFCVVFVVSDVCDKDRKLCWYMTAVNANHCGVSDGV